MRLAVAHESGISAVRSMAMNPLEHNATAPPAADAVDLSEGERRAQRTLKAARRLLVPEEQAAEASSTEAELRQYVQQAYRRRF